VFWVFLFGVGLLMVPKKKSVLRGSKNPRVTNNPLVFNGSVTRGMKKYSWIKPEVLSLYAQSRILFNKGHGDFASKKLMKFIKELEKEHGFEGVQKFFRLRGVPSNSVKK
jgi:hypothetical protein